MRYIVTTTINPPTTALRKFAEMPGWRLVVVGDLKTPHDEWADMPVEYLSPGRQVEIDKKLSDLIGWNCIQRRNMGFVWALQHGAELVATVDDDNIPMTNWGKNLWVGESVAANVCKTDQLAFDPLKADWCGMTWHRGFPIQWVKNRKLSDAVVAEKDLVRCDVQANLWEGEPDIDAICRMTTIYDRRPEIDTPLASNKPMPFNSQNTILSAAALKDYFCFPGVGRMDDIYGAYVCQAYGHRVVFGEPTVYQERNQHDITKDFEAEIHGYLHCAELVTALATDRDAWRGILPAQSAAAWDRYRELTQ